MKISQRKAILCIIASAIFVISLLNIVIFTPLSHAQPASRLEPHQSAVSQVDINEINPIEIIEHACGREDGRIPPLEDLSISAIPRPGSQVAFLPPDLYPAIHQSCYFLPTSPRLQQRHTRLLQYYPNSFLVVTSKDEEEIARVDLNTRTIYIRGEDLYNLLWIKTMVLWDYLSTQSSNEVFKNCHWFFKVDTDTFLNLHVVEQYLSQYSYKDDHYVGWYSGGGGRKHNNQTINAAIGAFYGFSRSLMQQWHTWQHDNKFQWGHRDDHNGEDSQVSFFLREHGVCLGVPVVDVGVFRRRGGIWGGFEHAHPLGPTFFNEHCTKMITDMVENECFTYAHNVGFDWMPFLVDVMKTHARNGTKCQLFGKGISRVVNGTFYRQSNRDMPCAVSDKCVQGTTDDSCGWERTP